MDLPRIYQGEINTGGATLADARGAEGLRRLGTAGRQQEQNVAFAEAERDAQNAALAEADFNAAIAQRDAQQRQLVADQTEAAALWGIYQGEIKKGKQPFTRLTKTAQDKWLEAIKELKVKANIQDTDVPFVLPQNENDAGYATLSSLYLELYRKLSPKSKPKPEKTESRPSAKKAKRGGGNRRADGRRKGRLTVTRAGNQKPA